MALPSGMRVAGDKPVPRSGIILQLFAADVGFDIQVERAPDSGGAPNTGAITVFSPVPGTTPYFCDPLPVDGATYWYRVSHVRSGYTAGPATAWKSAVAEDFPETLPTDAQSIPSDGVAAIPVVLSAGMIQNDRVAPTRAIRLDAATPLPGGLTHWLDLAASAGAYIARFASVFLLDTAGNLTISGTVAASALNVLTGVAEFAGTLLSRGVAVFAEAGGSASAGKRLDLTGGSLSVFQDAAGSDASEVLRLGSFQADPGVSLTKQDTSWGVTSGSKVTTSNDGGAATDTGPTNAIDTGADLPAIGGKYYLDFTAQIQESWGLSGTDVVANGYVVIMLYVSTDGGATWSSGTAIDSLTHTGARNTTTSRAYSAFPVTVAAVNATNGQTVFKLVPKVFASVVNDSGGNPVTVTATGTLSVTGGTSKVAWSKASGTPLARRGAWFRAKNSQPALSVEPHRAATNTLPGVSDLAEGEVFYDGDLHRWVWRDSTGLGYILRKVEAYLDGDGTTSTGTASVQAPAAFSFPVKAGEKWRVVLEGNALGMATNGIVVNMTLPTVTGRTLEMLANVGSNIAFSNTRNTGADVGVVTYASDGWVRQIHTFTVSVDGTAQVTYKSGGAGNTTLRDGFTMIATRVK